MRKLIDERQSGKTTKLLYTSHTMGYPIIVCDSNRKVTLVSMANKLHLTIPAPITVFELNKYTGCPKLQKVLIDDAEDVLRAFVRSVVSGVDVEVISMCSEGSFR